MESSIKSQMSKLVSLRNNLVSRFIQRESEITAVLSSLLAGEPCILVGPPGTAKTAIVEAMAKSISAQYFYYLLTRFTEPDELLGPLDINALREGAYQRITEGRLPTAHIAFLDEIFKASSAVRNILLDIILNKRYLNGTTYKSIPLLALYTASNEISSDSEDQAFYDRLLVRSFVNYVGADAWSELLKAGISLEGNGQAGAVMDRADVVALQNYVIKRFKAISSNSTLISKYIQALTELKGEGIEVSDRRKVKILKLASAISILYMESDVSLDSLADALRYSAVYEPDDLQKVEKVIMSVGLSSFYQHLQQVQALTSELRNALSNAEAGGVEELKALTAVYKKTLSVLASLPRNPRLLPYVREVKAVATAARGLIEKKKREIFGDLENS